MRRYQCAAVWQYLLSLAGVQWSMCKHVKLSILKEKEQEKKGRIVSAE